MKNRILITCSKGITPFLKEEVLALGFPVLEVSSASVTTEGKMDDVLRLNMFIKTGQRVLYLLKEFEARNPDELYREVYSVEWEDYIDKDGYICVTSSVENPSISDSRYAYL